MYIKIINQTAIQPYLPDLSLHVEKYKYSNSSFFLQLQPSKKQAKPSPSRKRHAAAESPTEDD